MKAGFPSGTGSKLISGYKDWLVLDMYIYGMLAFWDWCLSASGLGQDIVHLGYWACINLNKVELYHFGSMEIFISRREIISNLSLERWHSQRLFFLKESSLNALGIFFKSACKKEIGVHKVVVVSGAC